MEEQELRAVLASVSRRNAWEQCLQQEVARNKADDSAVSRRLENLASEALYLLEEDE